MVQIKGLLIVTKKNCGENIIFYVNFVKLWADFLSDVTPPVQPVLFQHLTDEIFTALVQDYFQVQYLEEENIEFPTDDENNVIRYIAGYVCHHLRSNLEKENHELKEELVLCLMDLKKDKTERDRI